MSATSSDEEFHQEDQGKDIFPSKAGQLRKNDFVVAKEKHPCKIIEVTTSKTGKHGHAKAHITCVDIFTSKKYEINEPTSHNLMCPRVVKNEYDLIALDDEGNVTYLDADGNYDETLRIDTNSDIFTNIKSDLDAGETILISVTTAMGQSHVTSHRKE